MRKILAMHLDPGTIGVVTILVSVLALPLQSNLVGVYASELIPTLKTETIVSGLEFPTGLAFLGQHDILVIEKDTGKVKRIVDGEMLKEPLVDTNVSNEVERGLLGIATAKNITTNETYVFLFYTESEGDDGGEPIGNRLYRYELVNNKLVSPKLLLDLPVEPGPAHNGGVTMVGPDNNVYVVVGNLYSPALNKESEQDPNLAQNQEGGKQPDGRGGIIRITQDGKVVDSIGILGDEHPLDMYYAYGIRNSFGMNFDPITGKLWDTENGGRDEINLVEPGFNSGYDKISGMASLDDGFDPDSDLVDFDGRGKYSDPELDLGYHFAPTAILFLDSDKLGDEYNGDMFIGSAHGNLYHFDLDNQRINLSLDGRLVDKVADELSDTDDSIVAQLAEIITDLDVGPDGYLYGTTYNKNGTIFRILPGDYG